MKVSLGTTLLATLAVSVMASSAMAANPNGPKPKCPVGQIAVVENGEYVCKEATLKAPGTSAERGKVGSRGGRLTVKKPNGPKADFVILYASKVGGTKNKFGVQIKNQGGAPTSGGFLQGLNMGDGGGGATAPMPMFKAGETKFMFVEFHSTKFSREGRIKFIADYGNDIPESNENNNSYSFNY